MAKTIRELTADLLAAPSACKEVKEAAQNYLDAAGKEGEAAAAKAYVAELEADIMSIDGLISSQDPIWERKSSAQTGRRTFWPMPKSARQQVRNTATVRHAQPVRHCWTRKIKF